MEIKFKDVSYQYQHSNNPIFKNINMSLKEGKINGLLGTKGAGKTTLLELLVGLRFPTNGYIQIGDFVLSREKKPKDMNDLRFEVGMVFQFPEEQIFNKTVRAELELGMKFFNYKLDQLEKRVKDVLKMVELDESYLDMDPLKLSSGEQRKVALASILIFNPKVLVLDEPTIGLDNESKKSFIRLITTLKQRYHKTIFLATHDAEVLHKIADYIVVLKEGTILLEGDKYHVFKQVKLLKKNHISVPKIMEFSSSVYTRKNIKIGYRDDINDLIKDIYRYVR